MPLLTTDQRLGPRVARLHVCLYGCLTVLRSIHQAIYQKQLIEEAVYRDVICRIVNYNFSDVQILQNIIQ